jgi:hypothetical protein
VHPCAKSQIPKGRKSVLERASTLIIDLLLFNEDLNTDSFAQNTLQPFSLVDSTKKNAHHDALSPSKRNSVKETVSSMLFDFAI